MLCALKKVTLEIDPAAFTYGEGLTDAHRIKKSLMKKMRQHRKGEQCQECLSLQLR